MKIPKLGILRRAVQWLLRLALKESEKIPYQQGHGSNGQPEKPVDLR